MQSGVKMQGRKGSKRGPMPVFGYARGLEGVGLATALHKAGDVRVP